MNPEGSLSILSAMITPAVLIGACAQLILSTSNRVGRASDRVRSLTTRFKHLAGDGRLEPLAREEKRMIIGQLPRITRRVSLLQRALTSFYAAVAVLVLTSILIGVTNLTHTAAYLLPVVFAMLGALILAYGSLLLMFEAQLSHRTTRKEMLFLQSLGDHYAEMYRDEE